MNFDYEQKAFNNEPLPVGLSMADTFVFLSLRSLYQQFKKGELNKDNAQKEKKLIEKTYSDLVFREKLNDHSSKLYLRVNQSGNELLEAISRHEDVEAKALQFYKDVYNGVLPSEFLRKE